MLNIRIPLVMLTIITTAIFSKAIAQQEESVSEQEVNAATKQLIQAMLKPTGDALNKLASDKLSYGHSSGNIETKEEFVHTLVSGGSVFEEIQLSDEAIDVQDNTAIVRHVLSARINDPGKDPANIRLGVILTWVKTDGNWQLLARQAVKL